MTWRVTTSSATEIGLVLMTHYAFKFTTTIINTMVEIKSVTQVTHGKSQVLPVPQTISNCKQVH